MSCGEIVSGINSNQSENYVRALGNALTGTGLRYFVIGRDGRESGGRLAEYLAEGIYTGGGKVINAGIFPEGGINHIGSLYESGAGITISGGEGDKTVNGIRITVGGRRPDRTFERELYSRLKKGLSVRSGGKILSAENSINRYLKFVKHKVNFDFCNSEIVFDCGHGSMQKIIGPLCAELNIKPRLLATDYEPDLVNEYSGMQYPEFIEGNALSDAGISFSQAGDGFAALDGGRVAGADVVAYRLSVRDGGDTVITEGINGALKARLDEENRGCFVVEENRLVMERAFEVRKAALAVSESGLVLQREGDAVTAALCYLAEAAKGPCEYRPFARRSLILENTQAAGLGEEFFACLKRISGLLKGMGRLLLFEDRTLRRVKIIAESSSEFTAVAAVKEIERTFPEKFFKKF